MHDGGNRVASKTPCHGSAGTGLRKRRPSTGGFAKGTPLNTCTSRPSTIVERPRMGPLLVWTTSRSKIPYAGLITVMHSSREIILHHNRTTVDIFFFNYYVLLKHSLNLWIHSGNLIPFFLFFTIRAVYNSLHSSIVWHHLDGRNTPTHLKTYSKIKGNDESNCVSLTT